jgi:ABC-type Fe3+ transport system permease subunit
VIFVLILLTLAGLLIITVHVRGGTSLYFAQQSVSPFEFNRALRNIAGGFAAVVQLFLLGGFLLMLNIAAKDRQALLRQNQQQPQGSFDTGSYQRFEGV